MGDTQNTGRHQGGADAVEGVITHGPENAVHRRSPTRRAVDHRTVRALRHLPEDGVQVDRALPAAGAPRPGGALAAAAPLAESDVRRDRERDPGRPAPASDLGRQKAAGAVAQAPAAMAAARPFDGVRHPEAAWDGAD